MLKRIFIIALFTGAGQLFIVFALKYISQHSSAEQIKAIGQIDSLILFMMNVIALGLQPTTMRNLATTREWKQEYDLTQSARLALSFFIAALALLAFTDKYYLAFLTAPLLALSGDYALYGKGFPVKGAMIAFVRAVIPFLLVLIFLNTSLTQPIWIYIGGIILAYLSTNIFISLILKTFFIPKLRFSDLKLYITSLPLGFVSLSLYFIGMGVLLVAQYFYPDPVLATTFVGLKFYVIFKGVLRIIHQAFFVQMADREVGLKVDQLSSLLGISFFSFIVIFPNTFIDFFFGKNYLHDKEYFILLAAAALIYSMFASFTTKAMLEKNDTHYSVTATTAAVFTLALTVVLSIFRKDTVSIGISLLAGEIFFAAGMLRLMKEKELLPQRILFIVRNLPFIVVPLVAFFIAGDSKNAFFITAIVFAGIVLLWYRKKFHLPVPVS